MMYTAAEKRDAIQRELAIRRQVYPGRVERHRMTQRQMDYQIAIFEEIWQEYDVLVRQGDLFT